MSQLPAEQENKTKQLDADGKKTLNALLAYRTKSKAAEVLGIGRTTLYERIERYGLNEIIDNLPIEALRILKLGSEKAAEVLIDALDERANKMQASLEILDRVGIAAPKTTVASQVNFGDVGNEMAIKFITEDDRTPF